MPDLETQIVYRPPAGRAVEAPWGEGVARSVVQKFTSVTARNAAWTTPPAGSMCATTDTDQLWFHTRTAGAPGWEEVAQLDKHVSIMMPKTGGTFTGNVSVGSATDAATFTAWGALWIRSSGDTPYIDFRTKAATSIRLGYFQMSATGAHMIVHGSGTGRVFNVFLGQGTTADPYVERFRVEEVGARVTGTLKTIPSANGAGGLHAGGDGPQIKVVDTNTKTGNADAYIGFYSKGTVDAPGALGGRIGYVGSGQLQVENLATSGSIYIKAPYGIALYCGGVERARVVTDGVFSVGRTSTGVYESDPGIDLRPGGQFVATSNANNVPSWMIHTFNSAADNDGVVFITFRRGTSATATAQLGFIAQKAENDVTYGHGSDYRLKNDLGSIPNAADRLMRLRPIRATWRESRTGEEFDCFLAHEVAEVVPYAVLGEKDEMYPDDHPTDAGRMKIQGLDEQKMVPLIVAALQEAITRIGALEAAWPS